MAKILMLGNKRSPYCSEVYYWRTFQDMAHEVVFLQESEATGADIIRNSNVDAFFWVHTHGWPTHGIDGAIQFLKDKGVPTFGYHLDLYMGLERWKEYSSGSYIAQLDYFFTVDKLMAEWLNTNTKTKGEYLPAATYEKECGAGVVDKAKYPHDIIFTGAKSYHKEWPYRSILIEWLHKTYGDRFGHYGNGGGLPVIRGTELNNLYTSAKIVIGDTLCPGFKYPMYYSDRLFESCGKNAFLIFPRIPGITLYYQERKEIVLYDFNDFQQLKSLIDYYLVNDAERESIRAEAVRRTLQANTYRHRLQQILDTLNIK